MGKRKRQTTSESTAPVKKNNNKVTENDNKNEDEKNETKQTNKQRVLVFSARGITYRVRHLQNDLRAMMPHSKSDSKLDNGDKLSVINEICELRNCNKCLFFQVKKKEDIYLWISNTPHGPSAKFLVENIHTMDELKLTGNCLKGSRPIVSFDKDFTLLPHYALLKELFSQIFSTPRYHPRSKPFIDHVFTFSLLDNRIWFRNYQIVDEDGKLAEIGPRFTLNLIRIFEGSFGGPTLYENPTYKSPNEYRRILRKQIALQQHARSKAKQASKHRKRIRQPVQDEIEDVFAQD